MKHANYDSKPSVIEAVGNGSYLYRWDIEEVTTEATEATDEQEAQEAHTSWECYEVTVWNTPTENSITEVVVDALWGSGVEQKLLNDYQASLLGVLGENSSDAYIVFLTDRQAIKQQIARDFAEWVSLQ